MMHSVTTWCGVDTHAIYCVKLHGDVVEQSLSKEINYSEAFQPRGSVTKQCHHLLTVISRICHPITTKNMFCVLDSSVEIVSISLSAVY